MARSSASTSLSLRGPDRFSRRCRRMAGGTVASISASNDDTPTASSMAATSAPCAPRWRRAKSSDASQRVAGAAGVAGWASWVLMAQSPFAERSAERLRRVVAANKKRASRRSARSLCHQPERLPRAHRGRDCPVGGFGVAETLSRVASAWRSICLRGSSGQVAAVLICTFGGPDRRSLAMPLRRESSSARDRTTARRMGKVGHLPWGKMVGRILAM